MKGHTEGEIHPGDIAMSINAEVDHVRRGGSLTRASFTKKFDEQKIKRFVDVDFSGLWDLTILIQFILDRHIGKVIVPGARTPKPFPRLFPFEPDLEKTRTKAEIDAFIAAAKETITPDEIVDEVQSELEILVKLEDVELMGMKTEMIRPLIEQEPDGWLEVLDLMRYTTDRYVGDIIESGSQGVYPWPKRSL